MTDQICTGGKIYTECRCYRCGGYGVCSVCEDFHARLARSRRNGPDEPARDSASTVPFALDAPPDPAPN